MHSHDHVHCSVFTAIQRWGQQNYILKCTISSLYKIIFVFLFAKKLFIKLRGENQSTMKSKCYQLSLSGMLKLVMLVLLLQSIPQKSLLQHCICQLMSTLVHTYAKVSFAVAKKQTLLLTLVIEMNWPTTCFQSNNLKEVGQ